MGRDAVRFLEISVYTLLFVFSAKPKVDEYMELELGLGLELELLFFLPPPPPPFF